MKTNINRALLIGGIALALGSCSEDAWNNRLEGFEGGVRPTDVQTIKYEMTDNDYTRLANNRFNKALAKADGVEAELKAVGTDKYLNPAIPADKYIPNLLKDSLFSYYTLSDGSAINISYREVDANLPDEIKGLNGDVQYVVSQRDYQYAYGSTSDYAMAFSPSYPAATLIPGILADVFDYAAAGEYRVVKYNESDTDPDFGQVFEMSDVVSAGLTAGSKVEIQGIVTAICTRGVVVTDKGGSILVYSGSFPSGTYKVGDQVKVNGAVASYKNCLQIDYNNATVVKLGEETYTYPAPVELTADYLVKANGNEAPVPAVYAHITGTMVVDGNFYNVMLDGSMAARGSVYNPTDAVKARLEDGRKVSLLGYFTQTSTSKLDNGDEIVNANFVVTDVEYASKAASHKAARRVASVTSVPRNAAYVFDGSKWSAAGTDVVVLQPADYEAMGQSHGNLSGSQPDEFLPIFLTRSFPYAQKDDTKFVAYLYYAGDETKYACSQYTFTGTDWIDSIGSNGVTTVTSQFVLRDGKWQLDPSVTLTLPAGRNQPASQAFFQPCVDWVLDNVTDGAKYVTSYGNNDYYTGASAYQGNFDFRASSAKTQCPDVYGSMSDEEVVRTEQMHFEREVGPGVLAQLYPEMAPVGELQPTVTINCFSYNGKTTDPQTVVFRCVEKGKFEFVSATWNEEESAE